ncbi:phage portal protein [Rhodococcus sp. MEB041]|uniref:phage portal protein n=1 Tax=Rhodococcus sp. MEB041 TaxID=3040323 RepID=UPI002550E624|nr:phage portal protein [Rhodococcus sp. MEB041]
MGLASWFGFGNASETETVTYASQPPLSIFDLNVLGKSPEQLWREQPHLRTVVTFVARNIAQLGLHTFARTEDGDRIRLRDDPMPLLLKQPNAQTTGYELIFGLVADLALFDVAYWYISESEDSPSGWVIHPIPPTWVQGTFGQSAFAVDGYKVAIPNSGKPAQNVPAENMLAFHGWNPTDPRKGSSPVDALKSILSEQMHAQEYREQVWKKGGRVGAVMTRPAEAPKWTREQKDRFSEAWAAKYAGDNAPAAGGVPILEDGMSLTRVGFSAKEDEYVEGNKLALSTVAQVYHVNPTMIGLLDNANYSNVKEFRRALLGDTLGPTMAQLEDRINTFLVPRVTAATEAYVEFNVAEKLQGSFEEQAAARSTAVGRPWLTVNEVRAQDNLAALEDGGGLVTPLNVLVGGQASPRDSAPPKQRSIRRKERAPETFEEKAAEVLVSFFRRQEAKVVGILGAKANEEWWDEERWNSELSDDLLKIGVLTAGEVGPAQAEKLGFDPDEYDPDSTVEFLRAVAASRASAINATTRDQIAEALASNDESHTPSSVFEKAKTSRALQSATALVTTFSAFGAAEAGKQLAPSQSQKTWIVNSRNPRSSHAYMDGETVGIDDVFSNGMTWPGDPVGGADEVAGCQCSIEITLT